MNVGLLYTPVSIYQMTRGALVLFVGILSVVFLRRRLWLYQWSTVSLHSQSAVHLRHPF
jgi:drug/metabolite transporter (DMT)-like permease